MKELKNKVDSIRRTLKAKNITVTSQEIENKILELCSNYPDDWCSDIRIEVIKTLTKDNQTTELVVAEDVSNLQICNTANNVNTVYNDVNGIDKQDNQDNPELVSDAHGHRFAAVTSSPDSTVIAIAEKTELVASTAQSMGIELQLSEVESIADNLTYSGDSLDEGIAEINQAITAFVEYKAQINQQKIDSMVDEVRHVVQRTNAETSQHLNNGLKQIAQDINQGTTDFKSQIRTALKYFAVSSLKAS